MFTFHFVTDSAYAGCERRYFYHLSGMKMDPWDNRRGGLDPRRVGLESRRIARRLWTLKSEIHVLILFPQKTMAFYAIGWDVGVLDFETYPTYHCYTSHHDPFNLHQCQKDGWSLIAREKHECYGSTTRSEGRRDRGGWQWLTARILIMTWLSHCGNLHAFWQLPVSKT